MCGGWQKIKNKIETFTVERFGENAARGREGFEMVLKRAKEVFQEESLATAKARFSLSSASSLKHKERKAL